MRGGRERGWTGECGYFLGLHIVQQPSFAAFRSFAFLNVYRHQCFPASCWQKKTHPTSAKVFHIPVTQTSRDPPKQTRVSYAAPYQSALFKQSISASCERRSLTHSKCDPAAASCRALFKSLFRCSISTPFWIKNFIKSRWPRREATIIGVSPDFEWTQFNIAFLSELELTTLINSSHLFLCTRRRGRGYSEKSPRTSLFGFSSSSSAILIAKFTFERVARDRKKKQCSRKIKNI